MNIAVRDQQKRQYADMPQSGPSVDAIAEKIQKGLMNMKSHYVSGSGIVVATNNLGETYKIEISHCGPWA